VPEWGEPGDVGGIELVSDRRDWLASPVRDAALGIVLAAVLVLGSYGEGHPRAVRTGPAK